MEEFETQELDQNTDAQESSSETQSNEGNPGDEAKSLAPKPEEPTPFHEHPRFKELVEQKNQALAAQKSLEQKLSQIEQRFSQPQQTQAQKAERDDLIEDLKKIDPRLADRLEKATKSFSTIEQLQSKLEQFEKSQVERERQQTIQTAVSKINHLHESNKVSSEVKQMINDKLDLLYMQGKLNMQNLDSEYKNAYDGFNKYIEALKRSERESYVAAKKQDAQVPTSQPKGQPAKQAPKKPNWSTDKETARSQIVNRFLKQQAANKEADSV